MKIIDLKKIFYQKNKLEKIKLYRQLWHETMTGKVLPNFPLNLDTEFSAICNLKCKQCVQRDLAGKIKLGVMSFNTFKDIIDEGVEKGACAIKSCLRGEPFMQPKLFDMIDYAHKKGIIDIILTSNATLFNDSIINNILNSNITGIAFSFDPHHSQAFEESGKSYSIVEDNINSLLEQRKVKNLTSPWIRIQTNIYSSGTKKELLQLKEEIKRKFPLADMYMVGRILDFNPDNEPFPNTQNNYVNTICQSLFHRMFITWDGKMLPCGMDYREQMVLGNIKDNSISSIWLSPEMNIMREKHIANKMDDFKICRHCHFRYKPKNEELFMEDAKQHAEKISDIILNNSN